MSTALILIKAKKMNLQKETIRDDRKGGGLSRGSQPRRGEQRLYTLKE